MNRNYEIDISNKDKILFPKAEITKGEVIEYYRKVSKILLPHIEDHPITMERYPDGIDTEGFYHKDVPDYFPDWIDTVLVEKKEGGKTRYLMCNKPETLIYIADKGCITPHAWLSKKDNLHKPNKIIFDLDPPEGKFDLVCRAAKDIRKLLQEIDLETFVMTTGSKGLHVIIPIKANCSYDRVRNFASDIAQVVACRNPESYTVEQRKEKRRGRVFLDMLRNSFGQTGVTPYAIRPIEGAPVAMPLEWHELDDPNLEPRKYTIKNSFRRLGQKEDPWKDIRSHAISLMDHEKKLEMIKT